MRQPKENACPLMAKTMGRVSALAYDNLPIAVSVFDSAGQKFDNISTFDIRYDNHLLIKMEIDVPVIVQIISFP